MVQENEEPTEHAEKLSLSSLPDLLAHCHQRSALNMGRTNVVTWKVPTARDPEMSFKMVVFKILLTYS